MPKDCDVNEWNCASFENDKSQYESTLISRNLTIYGRRTSVRLEPEMWQALAEVAMRENCNTHDLCTLIHMRKKTNTSLTAAIRVFLMLYYNVSSTEEGHQKAGHGCFNKMKSRARIPPHKEAFFTGKKERRKFLFKNISRQKEKQPLHVRKGTC